MKIFCKNCCHLDRGLSNFCKVRKIFINANKGRHCHNYQVVVIPQLSPKVETTPNNILEPIIESKNNEVQIAESVKEIISQKEEKISNPSKINGIFKKLRGLIWKH